MKLKKTGFFLDKIHYRKTKSTDKDFVCEYIENMPGLKDPFDSIDQIIEYLAKSIFFTERHKVTVTDRVRVHYKLDRYNIELSPEEEMMADMERYDMTATLFIDKVYLYDIGEADLEAMASKK